MRRMLLVCVLSAACGGSSDGSSASGAFSIEVTKAESRQTVGGLAPMPGRTFAVLDVKIRNRAEARPVLASGALFSVTTEKAISVPISGALAKLKSPCVDLSVARGGELTCGLAFEVPTGDKPVTLSYDDRGGYTAENDIPELVRGCYSTPDQACGSCLVTSVTQCYSSLPAGCSEAEATCFYSTLPTTVCAPEGCSQNATCKQSLTLQAECLRARCAAACGY